MYITEAEARSRNLTGCDTFIYNHLIYKDDLHRDYGVTRLNVEAYRAFMDTILISKYSQIAAERKIAQEIVDEARFNPIAMSRLHTSLRLTSERINYINLENFKISTGFELAIKARLLSHNCIIHLIDEKQSKFKELAQKQHKHPILRDEYFKIDSYRYDSNKQVNKLIALKDASLNYGLIFRESGYKNLLNLPEEIIKIADDYRKLRNQVHCPGDIVDTPHLSTYDENNLIHKIRDFINKYIVEVNNTMVSRHGLHENLCLPNLVL